HRVDPHLVGDDVHGAWVDQVRVVDRTDVRVSVKLGHATLDCGALPILASVIPGPARSTHIAAQCGVEPLRVNEDVARGDRDLIEGGGLADNPVDPKPFNNGFVGGDGSCEQVADGEVVEVGLGVNFAVQRF